MKIKNVNIKKFRQLENVEETKFGLVNELYGSNGCGKTSFISFITWILFGETLDYGKNDDMNIDSYKPFELIGGEITLENNNVEIIFAREFGYNETGKKTQDFFVNGRKVSNQKEYYSKIYKCFDIENFENLKIKNFDLLKALSDPYYLPNNENQFREFISAILNVNTSDILFEDEQFKEIEKDFRNNDNDYQATKDYYKQKLNETELRLNKTKLRLEELEDVKYNEEEFNELSNELNDLYNDNTNQFNEEIEETRKKIGTLYNELNVSKEKDLFNFENSEDKLELDKQQRELIRMQLEYFSAISMNDTNRSLIELVNEKLKAFEDRLEETKKTTFEEIKCPNCDTLINENDYKVFNKNKVETIKEIKEKIEITKKELKSYKIVDLTDLTNSVSKQKELVNVLEDKVKNLVNCDSEETINIKNEISKQQELLEKLENDYECKIEQERANKQPKISELKDKICGLAQAKDKLATLNIYKQNKETLLFNKSTLETRLNRLEKYRLKEIELIKINTKKIFGNEFDFEMLVKNKTTDSYKKVCYASINGLEHVKSNTAKYLKYAIMILEKIKDYIGCNDLPIVFDIADNIGKTARNEIFNLIKNSQVFYTRIADDDNVERKLNIIK